jgi:ABC-2 type transport system permease protein
MIEALSNICWAEGLKLRRSRALLMSIVATAMVPLAAAILALRGAWPAYLIMMEGASAIGGLIIYSLLMIWIFGREHTDHTSKELLTMPVPREMLAAGKILVASLWCLLLQCGSFVLGLALGACLGLPSWSLEAFQFCMVRISVIGVLSICLSIPFGFVANLSRGTMAAVGALFLVLFFASIMIFLGWGAYFPWAIPTLYSGSIMAPGALPGGFGFALVILTGIGGCLGSMAWLHWADQR